MASSMDKFDFLVTGDCKLRIMKEVDIEDIEGSHSLQ